MLLVKALLLALFGIKGAEVNVFLFQAKVAFVISINKIAYDRYAN